MKATVWTKPGCGYCTSAKLLLKQKNIQLDERVLGSGWTKEQLLEEVPTAKTLPQIFLDGDYVGGFTELKARLENGT